MVETLADQGADGNPNAEQSEYWNASPAAASWTSLHQDIDQQLAPLSAAAIAALAPQAGERILDVGCGCGATTLQLARGVAPGGTIVGLDISAPMLAVARRRAAAEGVTGVEFVEADAQTHAFDKGAFDAIFSRFGVMFFADPVAAFANLRTALRPGGWLAFLCWRKPSDNPCLMAPYRAAVDLFPVPPEKADPLAPGPFAFADAERIEGILVDAGFTDVTLVPHDQLVGGHPLDRALHLALNIGPLSRLLREQPSVMPQVTGAVRAVLAAHDGPEGVRLGSGTWVVTART